jgi:hypothetical protein
MVRYIPVRFPQEAYFNLLEKQKKIETKVRSMYPPNTRIVVPRTKVLIAITSNEVTMTDDYLRRMFGGRI